jgi:hypothetical protein
MINHTFSHRFVEDSIYASFKVSGTCGASETPKMLSFGDDNESNNANDPEERLVLPYDGFLLSFKWRTSTTETIVISIWEIASGTAADNADGTAPSSRIVTDVEHGGTANTMYNTMTSINPIAVSKGSIISVRAHADSEATPELDGVITFKFTI